MPGKNGKPVYACHRRLGGADLGGNTSVIQGRKRKKKKGQGVAQGETQGDKKVGGIGEILWEIDKNPRNAAACPYSLQKIKGESTMPKRTRSSEKTPILCTSPKAANTSSEKSRAGRYVATR